MSEQGFTGPACYENWKAELAGAKSRRGYEVPLYSYVQVLGLPSLVLKVGPYELMCTGLLYPLQRNARAWLVVRVEDYLGDEMFRGPDLHETDDRRYHGGGMDDEIAALISLVLGIRVMAGARTRIFLPGADPKGFPVSGGPEQDLFLPPIPTQDLVRRGRKTAPLAQCERLEWLLKLTPSDAVALVRAARMYQQALWLAASTSELTWLLLVTAVETVACAAGGVTTKGQPGAKARFVDFLLKHLPDAPVNRPEEELQVLWEAEHLDQVFRLIYKYRSQALHEGKPFPFPMCITPSERDGVLFERPDGLAVGGLGGAWLQEDTPIHLHVFEHIARGALLNWWKSGEKNPDVS